MKNHFIARMAELVDALVSKTSSLGSAGSTPAPGTIRQSPLFNLKPSIYYWHYFFFQPFKYCVNLIRKDHSIVLKLNC